MKILPSKYDLGAGSGYNRELILGDSYATGDGSESSPGYGDAFLDGIGAISTREHGVRDRGTAADMGAWRSSVHYSLLPIAISAGLIDDDIAECSLFLGDRNGNETEPAASTPKEAGQESMDSSFQTLRNNH